MPGHNPKPTPARDTLTQPEPATTPLQIPVNCHEQHWGPPAPQELPQPPPTQHKAEEEEDMTQVHLRVTRGTGLNLSGHIESLPIEWLLDTGCSTTFPSSNRYRTLPAVCPELNTYEGCLLSADDSTINILGPRSDNMTHRNWTLAHGAPGIYPQ